MESFRGSPAKAWLSLERLSLHRRSTSHPRCLFADVVENWAKEQPERLALISESETVTYRALSDRINRYACWALSVGNNPGDRVGLIMSTKPDYIAAWLGLVELVVWPP